MSYTLFKAKGIITASLAISMYLLPGISNAAVNVPPHTHYQAMKLIKAQFPDATILNVDPLRSTSISGTIGKVLNASTVIEIKDGSMKRVVTMLPDGQHLIIGEIVKPGAEPNEAPRNLTMTAPQTPAMAKTASTSKPGSGKLFDNYRMKNGDLDSVGGEPDLTIEEYLKALEQLPTITTGTGPRHLYAFVDPNCPNCRKEYIDSNKALDDFTFHWIPIYAVTPEPSPALVSIVQPEDADNLNNLSKVMVNPANVDLGTLQTDNDVIKRLQRNQLLFYRLNDKRTPVTIFRSSNGTPTKVNGHSSSLFSLIKKDMTGVVEEEPKQENVTPKRTINLSTAIKNINQN
ncbi:hypothetical protein [uncultured Amphritea sp.]|uniref:hypothetical protein n=1 Tax=uncultured Amphritea sp. TaxID=981605 RepID=UPI002636B961|nr:hypothetical protein [uncultured Amphritea sp.]